MIHKGTRYAANRWFKCLNELWNTPRDIINHAQLKSGHYFDGLLIKVWSLWILNIGLSVWRTNSATDWYQQISNKMSSNTFKIEQNNKNNTVVTFALEYGSLGNNTTVALVTSIVLPEMSWRSIIWVNASVGIPWPTMYTSSVVTAWALFVPLLDV